MQEAVKKLILMGQMPSDNEKISDERIDDYQNLLEEIDEPITIEEAENLVHLFPETSLFKLEWTLLHIVESIETDDFSYRKIIDRCPSKEWREILSKRCENLLNQMK